MSLLKIILTPKKITTTLDVARSLATAVINGKKELYEAKEKEKEERKKEEERKERKK